MDSQELIDLAPLLPMLLLGALIALGPVLWLAWRNRQGRSSTRWRSLAVMTLFLTFDLVLFGAFTRLTDSGLGCPDWPGCYGQLSPLGAHAQIDAAQAAMPTGPVTVRKAWIEMIHRYAATAIGALIAVLCAISWVLRRRRTQDAGPAPALATFTLAWVCLQGAFGAWTVTMKLQPAIVTMHLMGGMFLLALLTWQVQAFGSRPARLDPVVCAAVLVAAILSVTQVASGAWVSANYAVLACSDFPTCQGVWWPPMDFARAFTVWRKLGLDAAGNGLPFSALTAIHFVHRLLALATLTAVVTSAWMLLRSPDAAVRKFGAGLAAVAVWQAATGIVNVVLKWPLAAAVAHTGGAAVLVMLLAGLAARIGRRQDLNCRTVLAAS